METGLEVPAHQLDILGLFRSAAPGTHCRLLSGYVHLGGPSGGRFIKEPPGPSTRPHIWFRSTGLRRVCPHDPRGSSISHHRARSEEHTSELQSRGHLVCRLLLEKKKIILELTRDVEC